MVIDFNKDWLFNFEGEEKQTKVVLPHDAMLRSPRNPKSAGGSAVGFFTGGVYIYKKTFKAPAEWKNKHIFFEFQGIYRNAEVTINGQEAGGFHYGYSDFEIDADKFLKYGEDNLVEVRADNKDLPNSRWYSGGGILRPVYLHVQEKEHLEFEGIRVLTVTYKPAVIKVSIAHQGGDVSFSIIDKDGKEIYKADKDQDIVTIDNAELWSDLSPVLYTLKVQLKKGGKVIEEQEERFGIRKLEWSAKEGFLVNGIRTLLKGGCIHSDNGILGACQFKETEYRKAKILKEGGFNLIRSAHNPISVDFMNAADELGLFIMDELSDMWYKSKTANDYAKDFPSEYKEVIAKMVRKDYTHPSIAMYSIGNEITEPAEEKGIKLAKELADLFREADPSRPATGGINLMLIVMAKKGSDTFGKQADNEKKMVADSDKPKKKKKFEISSTLFNLLTFFVGPLMNKAANKKKYEKIFNPTLEALDISGYNYASGRYLIDEKRNPNRVIIGSETMPYTLYENWEKVKNHKQIIGDCMWTAYDYLGEAGIGAWAYENDGHGFSKPYPWIAAGAGAIDLIGHPGMEAGWAKAVWGLAEKPLIYVRPINHPNKPSKGVWRGSDGIDSWSWKNCEGKKALVEVCTQAPYVSVYLNGKKMGTKKTKKDVASFKIKYVSGELKAVALDSNKKIINDSKLSSAQGESVIAIHPEIAKISKGDVVFFDVNIEDKNGVVESNADTVLNVQVQGGTVLGFGSAQDRTEDKYYQGECHSYYGRALLAVRVDADEMSINVRGKEIKEASLTVKTV